MLVIAAYALHTAELYLARLWLPLLLGASLVRSGYDAEGAVSLAAALAGFMFMTGIGSVLAGGWLSDRLGRPTAAALIFSASGACSFAAGGLVGLPPACLVALGFVYGFVTAADSAIYSTAVTELAPRGRVGSTQAVQSFVGFGVGAAAPVLAGSILDASDSTMASASTARWRWPGWSSSCGCGGIFGPQSPHLNLPPSAGEEGRRQIEHMTAGPSHHH